MTFELGILFGILFGIFCIANIVLEKEILFPQLLSGMYLFSPNASFFPQNKLAIPSLKDFYKEFKLYNLKLPEPTLFMEYLHLHKL